MCGCDVPQDELQATNSPFRRIAVLGPFPAHLLALAEITAIIRDACVVYCCNPLINAGREQEARAARAHQGR